MAEERILSFLLILSKNRLTGSLPLVFEVHHPAIWPRVTPSWL